MEIYDYVVIGGGPAGLSAAIYLARSPLKGIVLEGSTPGGKLVDINRIDNYPGVPNTSGTDLALALLGEATSLGAEIVYKRATAVDKEGDLFKVSVEDGSYLTKNVIIATGLSSLSKGLEGENEFMGRGISHCATCDAAFYVNKETVVLGNGEKPLSEALHLALQCSKVTLLLEESDLKGSEDSIKAVKENPKVEIIASIKPLRFVADKKRTQIEGLEYEIDGKTTLIKADGYFVYSKENGPLALLSSLNVEHKGNFLIGDPETGETSLKGLYVAGDAKQSLLKQVVTAASDGAKAGSAIIRRAAAGK